MLHEVCVYLFYYSINIAFFSIIVFLLREMRVCVLGIYYLVLYLVKYSYFKYFIIFNILSLSGLPLLTMFFVKCNIVLLAMLKGSTTLLILTFLFLLMLMFYYLQFFLVRKAEKNLKHHWVF